MTAEEQERYARWQDALHSLENLSTEAFQSDAWEAAYLAESAAWDDMAEHNDPEYVRCVEFWDEFDREE